MKDLLEYMKFAIYDDNVLLSNQIAGFFDDQCLWTESGKVLDFLFRNSYTGKIAGLGYSGVLSHFHTHLHLLRRYDTITVGIVLRTFSAKFYMQSFRFYRN